MCGPIALLAPLLAAGAAPAAAGDEAVRLFERGSLRGAAAAAEQRIAANPADAAALAVLARVRAQERRYDEGVALGARAVKAAPGSADARYALAEVHGQAGRSAGPLKGLGAGRAFKREAEAALAIDPNHADAIAALIQFHRIAPGIVGGDRKQAEALAERLVAVAPSRGWMQRAQDALRAPDSAQADRCWRKAVESDPANGGAKTALAAWLAGSQRDVPAAERLALEVVEAEPWRVGAWQVLAGVQAHGRRWPELEATLAKSEAATGGRREAWYAAARQLIVEQSEPGRAERYLRHYLGREPEIGSLSHAAARWRLALALEQQSRTAEAVAELRAALRLDPGFDPAKKDLKRLKG